MEENPYSAFWGAVREDWEQRRTSAFRLGLVLSALPLTVQCGGIVLDREDLLVNEALLRGHKEQLELQEIAGTLHDHPVTGGPLSATSELTEPLLSPGDQVALLTEDNQIFALLCRVVKPV